MPEGHAKNMHSSDGMVVMAGMEKAARLGLWLAIPELAIFLIPYIVVWKYNPWHDFTISSSALLLVLVLPGILLHEGIHALFFSIFAPSGFRSVRFGIMWEYMSPYCHCSEPVKVWQYAVGAIAPLIMLGIVPAILGIIFKSIHLLVYGVFFIWSAAGDIYAVWLLKDFHSGQYLRDHEKELGFVVYDNSKSSSDI